MIQKLRERLEQRLSRQGPQLRLSLRNLYILPSGFGALWLLGSAVLYLIGINSGSNGPLLLAFLCTGLFLLSMFLTQFNLQGLELKVDEPPTGFAGELIPYPLQLNSRSERFSLRLRFRQQPLLVQALIPIGTSRAAPCWRPGQRGLHTPGRLTLYSKAPLGLFVCWSHWQPPQPQLIYPRAVPGPILEHWRPLQQQPSTNDTAERSAFAEDFRDLSPHRPEEGLQRVAWKQLARGRGWLAKRFDSNAPRQRVLSPDPRVVPEQALEHLTARVEELSQQGEAFALELPGCRLPQGVGRKHRAAALRALALA